MLKCLIRASQSSKQSYWMCIIWNGCFRTTEARFSRKLEEPCVVYFDGVSSFPSVTPPPLFCLWPSLFAPRTGWGDHTCGAEEFARVQTAFGAKATQETDAAGHPGRQGRRAARRLQGDDRDTLAADIKAFKMALARPAWYVHPMWPDVCFWWWRRCCM